MRKLVRAPAAAVQVAASPLEEGDSHHATAMLRTSRLLPVADTFADLALVCSTSPSARDTPPG